MRARGITLIELLVALAVLGVTAGVAALALRSPVPCPPSACTSDSDAPALDSARRVAILTGQPVTLVVACAVPDDGMSADSPCVALATAHPDGRIVADSGLAVDLFTGRTTDPRR